MKTPPLEPGAVYRPSDFAAYSKQPSRLVARLVKEGLLCSAGQGLYYAPKPSRFGPVPPSDEALVGAFLRGARFQFTGPEYWNTLGLGGTAMFVVGMVYNDQVEGEISFNRRRFLFMKEPLPTPLRAEWFVVDFINHHDMAGVALSEVAEHLVAQLRLGKFRGDHLRRMASRFGNDEEKKLVKDSLDQVLTARMIGIGLRFAGKPEPNAKIERTLVQASSAGMLYDSLRTLSVLTTWLGVHHACVDTDALARLVGDHRAPRVHAYWAAIGSWLGKKDPGFARLTKLYGGPPVELLEVDTDFQLQRRGEDPRFVGSVLRVPKGTLRARARDVVTPEVLARRHEVYRQRLHDARMNPRIEDRLAAEERARDDGARGLADHLAPMLEGLADLHERARAQGLFVEGREMLTCEECGLSEDEESTGLFVVRQYLSRGPDTGLRFTPDPNNEERFTCPACGAEVWTEPFDDLDGW